MNFSLFFKAISRLFRFLGFVVWCVADIHNFHGSALAPYMSWKVLFSKEDFRTIFVLDQKDRFSNWEHIFIPHCLLVSLSVCLPVHKLKCNQFRSFQTMIMIEFWVSSVTWISAAYVAQVLIFKRKGIKSQKSSRATYFCQMNLFYFLLA